MANQVGPWLGEPDAILLSYGRNPPFGFLGDHAFLVLAFGFASDSGMAGKVCGVQSIGTRVGAAGSCDA
jgi:hypothetical protein